MTFDPSKYSGFEWDAGNLAKSAAKHGVTPEEAEQVFGNAPLLAEADEGHSQAEPRWYALGRTNDRRRLFVAFAVRGSRIRVISSRPMSRKERQAYGEAEK